jgi:ribosome-binding protein aMBF1 (putative translation factor)
MNSAHAPGCWADGLLHFKNKRRKVKISRRDKSVTRDLQQLGGLIKAERHRAGLTVRQLADEAGLVASTVSRLENGLIAEPRPTHLQRLAMRVRLEQLGFVEREGNKEAA